MNRFKFFKIFCFVLSIAAALYYPVQKIISYEFEVHQSFEFKISNSSCLDGKNYIVLEIYPEHTQVRKTGKYAVLDVGKDGYAAIVDLVSKPDGRPCIALKNEAYQGRFISYPFDSFYISEKLAPVADALIRSAIIAKEHCALRVRVCGDGACSVEKLLVNGRDIKELAAERLAKK